MTRIWPTAAIGLCAAFGVAALQTSPDGAAGQDRGTFGSGTPIALKRSRPAALARRLFSNPAAAKAGRRRAVASWAAIAAAGLAMAFCALSGAMPAGAQMLAQASGPNSPADPNSSTLPPPIRNGPPGFANIWRKSQAFRPTRPSRQSWSGFNTSGAHSTFPAIISSCSNPSPTALRL